MGPGDGIQIQRLMDLPTTLETADVASSPLQQQGMQRVRSMLHNTASRPSASQRSYPEPPRRSLSHQGNMPSPGVGVAPQSLYNGVSPPGLPPRRPMVPPPMRPSQPRSPLDNSEVSIHFFTQLYVYTRLQPVYFFGSSVVSFPLPWM